MKVPENAGLAAMVTAPFSAPVWLVHAGRVKSVESSPSSLPALSAFVALLAVLALMVGSWALGEFLRQRKDK